MNLLVILNLKSAVTLKDYYKDAFSKIEAEKTMHLLFFSEEKNPVIPKKAQSIYEKLWRNISIISNLDDAICYCEKAKIKQGRQTIVITYSEQYIYLSNMLKKSLWQKISQHPEMYNNKDIQRRLLKDSHGWINFQVHNINEELDIEKIVKSFKYPFIIKPSWWAASNWVKKITNYKELIKYKSALVKVKKKLRQKEYNAANILVEEYIEGQICTIDYYVNQEWKFSALPPLFSYTNYDQFGWNDLWVPNQYITWKFTWDDEMWQKTEKFITETIQHCWIRNTFVHHEFFITPNNELKTIEINGRIWWYRLVAYKANLWINMLDLIHLPQKNYESKQVTLIRTLFPLKDGSIYVGNTKKLQEIVKSGEVKHQQEMKKRIGTQIWRAQSWHRSFTNLIINYDSLEELYRNNKLFDRYILEEGYYVELKKNRKKLCLD